MLRHVTGLHCNYCCLSDGSDFWRFYIFFFLISNRRNVHRDSRGRPKCSLLVHSRDVILLMKPAFVWLGFRGPDCNVIAEQGGGPDARPSWAGSGPRAGGCPTLL